MATRIAGIQPGYLPWLGYFDQMLHVDAFVVADELPYSSSGWTHRNRVKGPDGPQWLTLPVRATQGQAICEVALDPAVPWRRKHLATLRHLYADAPTRHGAAGRARARAARRAERLPDASLPTIRFFAERLGITTPILLSSELGLEARYAERFPERPGPTHRIVAYMEALGATELVEGEAGRSYFDVSLFERAGMRVHFHHYAAPDPSTAARPLRLAPLGDRSPALRRRRRSAPHPARSQRRERIVSTPAVDVSVVVPLLDEERSVAELVQRTRDALERAPRRASS